MSEEKKQKDTSKRQRILIVLLVVLLAAACVAGLAVYLHYQEQNKTPAYEREVAAKLGQLDGKSEAEIQAELNRVIGEGMFHISINADPVFNDGTAQGNLEIENVPNNHYLMRVEIVRSDTGETVYSTKYIEPNNHIQRVALDVELPAGEYPCTAVFYAYEPGSLSLMGNVSTVITLHVLH